MKAKNRNSSALQKLKSLVEQDFLKVNHMIYKLIESKKTDLTVKVSSNLINSGGKRIRSILTLACSNMFTYTGNAHIELATAVEYMHTSTLLHDDVIDESDTRRNVPTAHVVWGNKTAILVGDFLFSKAFICMVKANSMQALDILSNTSAMITESEVWQLEVLAKFDFAMQDYKKLIYAKTASLFAAACQVGAIVAGADEGHIKTLRDFGINLGLVFQMEDDIIDYIGNVDKFGKKIGNDLREGKVTLPILLIRDLLSTSETKIMKQIVERKSITDGDFAIVLDLLHKYNAFNKSYKYIEKYVDIGISKLQELPDNTITQTLTELISSYHNLDCSR